MSEPATVEQSTELVRRERKPVQTGVVWGLLAVVFILVITLGGVMWGFSRTLDAQKHATVAAAKAAKTAAASVQLQIKQAERRAIAQRAVNCYSEKQSQFSTGVTDALAGVFQKDDNVIGRALFTLRSVNFDACKTPVAEATK